jgi:transposase
MLDVEDWAEIRRMHRGERMPIKVIARVLGISKNTVKAALASDGPPRYERVSAGSIVDEVEPRIRELLRAVPTMPATVIAERIGWMSGMTVLTARVRVFCDGKVVADHDRLWAKHQTLSDPEHVAAAKRLRHQRIGLVRPAAEPDVQIRCLDDYDAALGLDGGVA